VIVAVKICGITNLRDAELAIEAGARALGFIFYGRSPRAISPGVARDIIRNVPRGVRKVGVFVNQTAETIEEIADITGIDMIQLSGDEKPGDARFRTPRRVVKAFRSRAVREIETIPKWTSVLHAVMIDSGDPAPVGPEQTGEHSERRYGGTGQLVDFQVARDAKKFGKPVILAGGLDAKTAVEGLRAVEPNAIDICSSVESQPGKKDPRRLKLLFDAIRRYEDELISKHSTSGGIFRSGPIAMTIDPPGLGPRRVAEPEKPSDLLDELPPEAP
jgi:phosphoribosylanthranilate isomerase